MASTDLWYRRFKRSPEDDEDLLADTAFREANFKDFFGRWLQLGQNANVNTLDEIMMEFWKSSREVPPKNSFTVFCVADGGFIQWDQERSNWLHQHVRFVAFISSEDRPFKDRDDKSWTFCINGSSSLKSQTAFLQVASWDTKCFRFYENHRFQTPDGYNRIGWIYQAMSTDAFVPETAYLGPFNGHVNGALVMKELHKPWLHWSTDNNNFVTRLSDQNQKDFSAAPYLTDQSALTIFSGVSSAESMEPIVENGVSKWYDQRRAMDFLDSAKKLLNNPSNVKRWISHLLLTTTTNIVPALSLNEQYFAPANHFYDEEMLSQYSKTRLMEEISVPDFMFQPMDYYNASQKLGLALLQDIDGPAPPGYSLISLPKGTLGGGKVTGSYDTTAFIQLQAGEGEGGMFTILQPSYEDAQGVLKMQSIKPGIGLLSARTFNALMLVDFWNPIFSWRRGVLMQYVPDQTLYDPTNKTYDLENQLIANVKNSQHFKNGGEGTPEHRFISLLDVKLEDMKTEITQYFANVAARLKTIDGMVDYLTLAESRRRIYRPLPLNEFGLTLPYAVSYGHEQGARFEMTETGNIQPVAARGMRYYLKLTGTQNKGSLAGFDPSIIPEPDDAASEEPAIFSSMATMDFSVTQGPVSTAKMRRLCPFRRANRAKVGKSHFSRLIVWEPTWEDDINSLFFSPYWLVEDMRGPIGAYWGEQLMQYGWKPDLQNAENVVSQAVTIYQHLRSRSIPTTTNPDHFWPDEALEMFRLWVNQGCRRSRTDPMKISLTLEAPTGPSLKLRVRKDIRKLGAAELQIYRAKLQDVLQVGTLKSKWQELGELHSLWCLPYQEETFFWYRAYLRYVEELIDFPIPYWNVFSVETANPSSGYAGLPSLFTEEKYIHPSREERENPLKYALSFSGKSRSGTSQHVQRDPILLGGRGCPGWDAKIRLWSRFHEEIIQSFRQATYRLPQDDDTLQAGIAVSKEGILSDDYQSLRFDFHNLMEQANDTFHGLVGGLEGDMGDNTYTAFDPIFLSYLCNMDRLVETFLRSNPRLQYSSNFPLRPFTGQALGPRLDIAYDESLDYTYTTIGDMAKDSRALGYLYARPDGEDALVLPRAQRSDIAAGGIAITRIDKPLTPTTALSTPTTTALSTSTTTALSTPTTVPSKATAGAPSNPDMTKAIPWIVYTKVGCTTESYEIDIFLTSASSFVADPANPDFVGRVFRVGMGRPPTGVKMESRCRSNEQAKVTRAISADHVRDRIGGGFVQVVRGTVAGRQIPEEEWGQWDGFRGRLVWVMEKK